MAVNEAREPLAQLLDAVSEILNHERHETHERKTMKDIITITHSNEGIRVSCDGTTRLFANGVYLAEAYAANVLAARQARDTIRGEAAACLAAIAEIGAKVVDHGTVGGEFLLEKLNELGELMTDAGAGLANF
jgi:hypothetical protein